MRNTAIVKHLSVTTFLIFLTLGWVVGTPTVGAETQKGSNATFSCADSEATLLSQAVTSIHNGDQAIYVGYQQVDNHNQNPIVARFDNGAQVWCRTDYETSDVDNRATGVYWNGTVHGLYLTFSTTGTDGEGGEDFQRFAQNGWLKHYADHSLEGGAGAKVAIIAQVNPADGDILNATFVTAMSPSNKTNSLLVTHLTLEDNGVLRVDALAWQLPRSSDKSRMVCNGPAPFAYTLRLATDLSAAVTASADNCVDARMPTLILQ